MSLLVVVTASRLFLLFAGEWHLGQQGAGHMLVPVRDIRVTKHLVLALLLCSNSFPAWIFALAARALNEIILMPL